MATLLENLPSFLEGFKSLSGGFETQKLKGDASYRSYFRLISKSVPSDSFILMQWDPALTSKSEEIGKKTGTSEFPFINVQKYLASGGINVPEILKDDVPSGMILLEDLGDSIMWSSVDGATDEKKFEIYKTAIDNLVQIQLLGKNNKNNCIAFERSFDNDLYLWEFDHYIEWCIEARTGKKVDPADMEIMKRYFKRITDELCSIEKGFTHRDYQSRNLMFQKNRLYVIDFQDALSGPPQYDLVALLKDSYVFLSEPVTETLIKHYLLRREKAGIPLEPANFINGFKLQTIQRKLKDAGRFVFIDRVKKNPSFLPHIPQSLEYVKRYLSTEKDLAELYNVLAQYTPELR